MLIGSDLYPHMLQSRADIIHTTALPSAMDTQLRWIVVGALDESPTPPLVILSATSTPKIEGLIQTFWIVEEPNMPDILTTEDEQCEVWFQKTTTRDASGRFVVSLPFRSTVASLPGKYFIPHHAMVKHEEKGLKIRVVIDASAKSTSVRSLNDCLCTGPKLQTEISDVLLRSRFYRYVFVADIAKMYRQIRVREEDCVYQHILWRRSPEEEMQEYQLLTVTYGVNSAPYLVLYAVSASTRPGGRCRIFPGKGPVN